MADNAIAMGVQVPDAMKSISGMLNIAGQSQNLQNSRQQLLNSQQQYQAGTVELDKQRIILGERKGIQELFQDPSRFTGDDGSPDYNKLINEGMKVAPTTFPTMVPQIIQAQKSSIDAKDALNRLNASQRDQVGQFIFSLAGDDPATARKKLDGLIENNPQLKPAVDFAWNYTLKPSAQDPSKWKEAVLKVGQAAMPPGAQVDAMTPKGPQVTNNAQTGTLNLAPLAGPVGVVPGSTVNMQLPLSERQTVSTNPVTHSPQTVTKDAFGNVQGVTQTPTGPGVPSLAPGQSQDIPIVAQERAATNNAASQIPNQRFNNQQIIRLASQGENGLNLTGPGAEAWSKVAGAVGIPWGTDSASNFQQLAHYIALQAQANAKAMGAGTDAAREVSHLATGSTAMTPQALVAATKANDALATGVELFNQGMEAAIRNAGGNVLAARDFKNEWSKNLDINVLRVANAIRDGDQGELQKITKEVGPEKLKALAQKWAALKKLADGK